MPRTLQGVYGHGFGYIVAEGFTNSNIKMLVGERTPEQTQHMLNGHLPTPCSVSCVMTSRKPKIQDIGGDKYTVDSGSDDSRRSGGFDPLLGWTGVGGAALTGAYIAGKQSGVGARVVNKIRGQEVYLHGSPTTGIKEIRPMGNASGSRLAFFENPKDRSFGDLGSLSSRYAQEKGSIYVVKGPKNSFKQDTEVRAMVISKQPQKVVSEIKLTNIGSNIDALTPAIKKALRKAGYNAPKKR